jgi:3',5'-cyclic-nucleotide phosphodiesterase
MQSLHELDALAGGNGVLKDLPVVITHIKYALGREQPQAKMRAELSAANDLGVRFLIPHQAMRWHFR